MMKRLFGCLWLFVFMATPAINYAQGIDFIHDKKLDELLSMAKAQNKLVFIDCYTSWCGPCKRLAQTVFPDSSVGEFFNATFINTKFDMEQGEGVNVSNKYDVRAYPTLLWLDGDGQVKHKIIGALDVQGLLENGKKAIDPTPGILAGMEKDYKAGNRNVNFLRDYANTLYNAGEKYGDIFKDYLDKMPAGDFTDKKNAQTIFNLTNDIKSPGMAYLTKNRDYYRNLLGDDAYNGKINQIAAKAESDAPRADDKSLFDNAIELLKSNKAPDHTEKILQLSMDYYARMGQWEDYDKSASQYIKKYGEKNAKALNDVAWDYYINMHHKEQLEKAVKWAYKAVNLDDKYTYNLTYAYLLYKVENYSEAEKACDYAIIRANAENVRPSAAHSLKELIEKELAKQKAQ